MLQSLVWLWWHKHWLGSSHASKKKTFGTHTCLKGRGGGKAGRSDGKQQDLPKKNIKLSSSRKLIPGNGKESRKEKSNSPPPLLLLLLLRLLLFLLLSSSSPLPPLPPPPPPLLVLVLGTLTPNSSRTPAHAHLQPERRETLLQALEFPSSLPKFS